MATLTTPEFRERLKNRSKAIAALANSIIDEYIDDALRAYSVHLPQVQVLPEQPVIDGQELYDYPADALQITTIWESSSQNEIQFYTENQDGTPQFRLGKRLGRSYDALLGMSSYIDPLNVFVPVTIEAVTSFDVEYLLLHTMASINERGLIAIAHYVEYLALMRKASEADQYGEMVDRDATGASSTLRQDRVVEQYQKQADHHLSAFYREVQTSYGTRG